MFAQVTTVAFQGIEARPVEVQVLVAPGLPTFNIVGLPDKAVGESRERVRAALTAVGLGLPPKRITINLAPADLPKEGSHYDLPIALGVMLASGAIANQALQDYVVIGELGLDGAIAPVTGALPAAVGASAISKGLICPAICGPEAAWASPDMDILAPAHLNHLISHLKGQNNLARPEPKRHDFGASCPDLRDVKGQETAKRALEIAAAGGHHMVMVGPPGSGKTMLASRLAGILPPLEPRELLDVAMIQSMAGALVDGGLTNRRPFRAPHHSASMAALVGGGSRARPGEVALAHQGVLFLDELPEFSGQVLDALRQPLESGVTVIARANHRISYPSRFQLVAAMNPCKCGRAGEPGFTCRRGQSCAEAYQARISGPLWDRIDVHIEMPAVTPFDLMLPPAREGSAEVGARVAAAREKQMHRYAVLGVRDITLNAHCPADLLEAVARVDPAGTSLLTQAAEASRLSARSYHRVLRLALTIADLDGSSAVQRHHVAEALSLRVGRSERASAVAA
jgi:magnesium chelatase family protein